MCVSPSLGIGADVVIVAVVAKEEEDERMVAAVAVPLLMIDAFFLSLKMRFYWRDGARWTGCKKKKKNNDYKAAIFSQPKWRPKNPKGLSLGEDANISTRFQVSCTRVND